MIQSTFLDLGYMKNVSNLLCARNVPFRTRFLGEVIISEDKCADGKEYVTDKMDTKGESTLDLEEREQIPTS